MGAHYVFSGTSTQIGVSSYIVHRNWSRITKQNDIALLRLSRNATLSPLIQTVTLAQGYDLYTAKNATIIGWGRVENGVISNVLKRVETPVMTNQACHNIFEVSINSYLKEKRCLKTKLI